MAPKTKLLDQMRAVLRLKHMSFRTEEAYVSWVRRFILFHDKRHPKDMGAEEIRAFLIHLAVQDKVAASTQNSALNALVFLYRHVLKQPFPDLGEVERAKRPRRVPTVFTVEEVTTVLAQLTGVHRLMASLLYGAGLRLMECVRLRVKDVDFAYHQITVRDGKGQQDRVTYCHSRWTKRSSDTSPGSSSCMKRIWQRATARCTCRMPRRANIPTRARPGCGSMSFLPPDAPSIRGQALNAGIIYRKQSFSGP
jgi:integrase